MELLETLLREYPESLQHAQVHFQFASCRERRGDIQGAVAGLRAALDFERGHPNVLTRAFFELGRLIAEHRLIEFYDEFLRYRAERAERRGHGGVEALFPLDRFQLAGALAVIHDSRGERDAARASAKAALAAADDKASPFRYHREIGLVRDVESTLYRQVVRLAADG